MTRHDARRYIAQHSDVFDLTLANPIIKILSPISSCMRMNCEGGIPSAKSAVESRLVLEHLNQLQLLFNFSRRCHNIGIAVEHLYHLLSRAQLHTKHAQAPRPIAALDPTSPEWCSTPLSHVDRAPDCPRQKTPVIQTPCIFVISSKFQEELQL